MVRYFCRMCPSNGWGRRQAHGAVEQLFFARSERTYAPLAQIAEHHAANGDADQAQDFDSEVFEHPANVPVFAGVENDFEPRIAFPLAKDGGAFHAQEIAGTVLETAAVPMASLASD